MDGRVDYQTMRDLDSHDLIQPIRVVPSKKASQDLGWLKLSHQLTTPLPAPAIT